MCFHFCRDRSLCVRTRVLVCVCVAPKLPGHLLPVDLPSAALFDFWSCWPPLSPYIPRSLAPFLSVSLRNDGGKFDSNGDVTDPGLQAEACAMVAELQRYTVALRAGGALDPKL